MSSKSFKNYESEIYELIRGYIKKITNKDTDIDIGYEILHKLDIQRFQDAIIKIMEIEPVILYPFFKEIFFNVSEYFDKKDKELLKSGNKDGIFVLNMMKYNVRENAYINSKLNVFTKFIKLFIEEKIENDVALVIPPEKITEIINSRLSDTIGNKKTDNKQNKIGQIYLSLPEIFTYIKANNEKFNDVITLNSQAVIPYKVFWYWIQKYQLLNDVNFMKLWLINNYYSFDEYININLANYFNDDEISEQEKENKLWKSITQEVIVKKQKGGNYLKEVKNILKETVDPTFHFYAFENEYLKYDKNISGIYKFNIFLNTLSYVVKTKFDKIKPIEFFNQAWTKPNLFYYSQNLRFLANFFNSISRFFINYLLLSQNEDEVTTFSNEEERRYKRRFYKCIKIINILVENGDWFTSLAINSSLNNSGVYRISKKLELPDLFKLYKNKDFEEICKNSKSIDIIIKNTQNIVSTFTGGFQTAYTFIDDSYKNYNLQKINFTKLIYSHKVISPIIKIQKNKLKLHNIDNQLAPLLISTITQLPHKYKNKNKNNYNRSLKLVPRS